MTSLSKSWLQTALLLAAATTIAVSARAAVTIDFTMDPGLPGFVQNPGGLMSATCWVTDDAPTPGFLEVSIYDEQENRIWYLPYDGYTSYYLYWYVPAGENDGIYHYQVDYTSDDGTSASARAGFLVAGQTRGICAFKFIDTDGDGIFDEDTEFLASGWEICTDGPNGHNCDVTSEDGVTCWFFIPAGTYEVCETLQPGYTPTTPVCQTVEVSGNIISKAIFGNKPIPPSGACCLPDGNCYVLSEDECMAQGGTYYGDNFPCDPNPCPQPTGACCLPDGTCQEIPEDICLGQGGTYYGDGTVCTPELCNPVPVEPSTWGRIKNQYR